MNAMFHRHLVAAYAVTWGIQLSYLAYAGWKWITSRRAQRAVQEKSSLS
jgi:hypothetical protein